MNVMLDQLQNYLSLIQANLWPALLLLGLLWGIFLLNFLLGYRLNILGIYPRHIFGIPGIFCSPFLHASFNHLFFNSIPFLVLTDFLLIGGFKQFIHISLLITLISGTTLWCFGRRAIHVGASGVIMGYFAYLLAVAYRSPSLLTIPIAIICLYYFGGLIFSLFPKEKHVSWEGHLFGFIAGLITAFLL